MSTLDEAHLKSWIGRSETTRDLITARPARLMQATLDLPVTLETGGALPPLWHWIYFPTEAPTAALGEDGHPEKGGFLPPVPLPRRMWAGGRFRFQRPLRLGEVAERRSTIESVAVKQGGSGQLCFVTVRHQVSGDGTPAFEEEHDIVYREAPAPGAPAPKAPPLPGIAPQVSRTITPSMPLLFRYSALTFNGHRIHYDLDYCRDVEGYPGCIVHGPLIATLLMGLASEMAGPRGVTAFSFRATAPLFHDAPFHIHGAETADGLMIWAERPDGGQAMRAEAVTG
ncbi:acyl-CoA dehydrogenase [Halovulum dunhuangense]|uniref:Acyl-CoA dehydrogenase n=1 Tax=Halovulum dunhuangense TaxID=1505036 RepID=A0A849KZF0_9RHOB|nr:MaoC family dehydratase N-terminal domain-containing protein [Halovulum dunhuangense]NNU79542.1 acyl-CoA dehydrogenase [Halovulum dunhuangense]